MIYADFKSVLVPRKTKEKQNVSEASTKNYQKHPAWSLGYQLLRVDNTFGQFHKVLEPLLNFGF